MAYVDDRGCHRGGVDDPDLGEGSAGVAPGVDATVEFAEQVLGADVEAVANEVAAVLVGSSKNIDGWSGWVSQPIQLATTGRKVFDIDPAMCPVANCFIGRASTISAPSATRATT